MSLYWFFERGEILLQRVSRRLLFSCSTPWIVQLGGLVFFSSSLMFKEGNLHPSSLTLIRKEKAVGMGVGTPQSLRPPAQRRGRLSAAAAIYSPPVPASPVIPAPSVGTACSMGLATPAFWARWGHSQAPLPPAWPLTLAVPPARQRMAELGGTSGGVCASPGCPTSPGWSNHAMGCNTGLPQGPPWPPPAHALAQNQIPGERRCKGSQRCFPPCQTPPQGSRGNPGCHPGPHSLAPHLFPLGVSSGVFAANKNTCPTMAVTMATPFWTKMEACACCQLCPGDVALPVPVAVGSRPTLHQRSPGKMLGVVTPAVQPRGTAEGMGQHCKKHRGHENAKLGSSPSVGT